MEVFVSLTLQQKLTIAGVCVGAVITAFGALAPIMTQTQTLIGTVTLGMISTILGGVTTVLTSTNNQVQTVKEISPGQLMTAVQAVAPEQLVRATSQLAGVTNIGINKNATPDVAAVALDPTAPKVAAVPADTNQVAALAAKG
jgi:hypothetical protein